MSLTNPFRFVVVSFFLFSLFFLTGHSQGQQVRDDQELEKKAHVIRIEPNKPVINLTKQQGEYLFGELFPAGQLIPANGTIQSSRINVGGASRVVIRMVADADNRFLRYFVGFGPLPSGVFLAIGDLGEVGNFRESEGQSIDLPVAGSEMVVQLENRSNNPRFLVTGATVYAVR